MPMVFGDLDPNYRFRQLDRVQQGGMRFLDLAMQERDRRRREEDRRRELDQQRFFELARVAPEAAIRYGEQLSGQLEGNERVALDAMVAQLKDSQAGGSRYLDEVRKREMERRQAMAMPDVPMLPGPAGTVAAGVGQAMGQVAEASDPRVDAYRALPFGERMATRESFERRGLGEMLPPERTPWDPVHHLPPKLRAVYAREQGWLSPDAARAADINAGLELSAGVKARQAQTRELSQARDERQDREYELASRREARLAEAQELKVSGGEDAAKREKDWWKAMEDDAAIASNVGARARAEAKSTTYKPIKPARYELTKAQQRKLLRLLQDAVKAGYITEDQAESVLHERIEAYQEMIDEGKTPRQAWVAVLGGE